MGIFTFLNQELLLEQKKDVLRRISCINMGFRYRGGLILIIIKLINQDGLPYL